LVAVACFLPGRAKDLTASPRNYPEKFHLHLESTLTEEHGVKFYAYWLTLMIFFPFSMKKV